MHQRQNERNAWLKLHFKNTPITLTPLAGDASFRRYFRIGAGPRTYVLMDAPPEKESIDSFLKVGALLTHEGVHTPKVHAVDINLGFVLLEDLGDALLLNALIPQKAPQLYSAAMEILHLIQQCKTTTLPHFDQIYILKELSFFRTWFLEAYLGLALSASDECLLDETFHWLTTQLIHQPQVFIHRDFHARNIMILRENPTVLAVIDFQDAMIGPLTYDLVSLLKDCYIQWPRDQVLDRLTDFYHRLSIPHDLSLDAFTHAFDLAGLQRHLKVLGIFCRLALRDNKPAYLHDLPLTFHYVMTGLSADPALQPMAQWMQYKVHSRFTEKVYA